MVSIVNKYITYFKNKQQIPSDEEIVSIILHLCKNYSISTSRMYKIYNLTIKDNIKTFTDDNNAYLYEIISFISNKSPTLLLYDKKNIKYELCDNIIDGNTERLHNFNNFYLINYFDTYISKYYIYNFYLYLFKNNSDIDWSYIPRTAKRSECKFSF